MTQDRRFAGLYPARGSAVRRGIPEERLPIWTAVAVVTGANMVLWTLVALALNRLLF